MIIDIPYLFIFTSYCMHTLSYLVYLKWYGSYTIYCFEHLVLCTGTIKFWFPACSSPTFDSQYGLLCNLRRLRPLRLVHRCKLIKLVDCVKWIIFPVWFCVFFPKPFPNSFNDLIAALSLLLQFIPDFYCFKKRIFYDGNVKIE